MAEEKRDFRQDITSEIIQLIEQGKDLPWNKEWESTGGLPMNPTTGQPYRGGNIIGLMLAGMRHGYGDHRWMTFKQMKDKSWSLKGHQTHKGRVEFWGDALDKEQPEDDNAPRRLYKFPRTYAVFNAEQIEGIPPLEIKTREPFQIIQAGEDILNKCGIPIKHGGNQAYYSKTGDYIQLPHKEQFFSEAAYYGVGIHECAHGCGHPSRLNRESLNEQSRFGSPAYAFEELIADLTSALVRAETGIPYDKTQTAAYMQSWLKALKDDKNAIFKAASDASKATDYLLQKAQLREKEPEEQPITHAARVSQSRQAYRHR